MEVAAVVTATANSVEGRIKETDRPFALLRRLLIGQSHHSGPHGRGGRSAADGDPAAAAAQTAATRRTSRTIDGVAGGGIGIERDIRRLAHTVGILVLSAGAFLPGGLFPVLADAAAACAAE